MIAVQSDLALAHNDQSVLEMHHSFITFELLRDPDMTVTTLPRLRAVFLTRTCR